MATSSDSSLFKEERRSRILAILESEHRVEVPDLAKRFNVSEDTVRRDLRELEGRGAIRKTHGGALRLTPTVPYENRLTQASEYKAAIGRAAAELVEEGDSVIIDSGTTALNVARSIKVNKCRIVTNSLEVANVIAEHPNYELILLGGKWDLLHQFIGLATIEQLSHYGVDKLFLGMTALDRRRGITVPTEEEASVKRAMIEAAQQVIALVDHTKLGKVAFAKVASVSLIDVLVTDDRADCSSFSDLPWRLIKVPIESGSK
ncbi:MAG: DeoR/GlpR family DNA-binding transcription regulator [Acidobacteriota bacterium]